MLEIKNLTYTVTDPDTGTPVIGTWRLADENAVYEDGDLAELIFTPNDTEKYESVSVTARVIIVRLVTDTEIFPDTDTEVGDETDPESEGSAEPDTDTDTDAEPEFEEETDQDTGDPPYFEDHPSHQEPTLPDSYEDFYTTPHEDHVSAIVLVAALTLAALAIIGIVSLIALALSVGVVALATVVIIAVIVTATVISIVKSRRAKRK